MPIDTETGAHASAPSNSQRYFHVLDQLANEAQVVTGRPRGQAHPRYADAIYPVHYGDPTKSAKSPGPRQSRPGTD